MKFLTYFLLIVIVFYGGYSAYFYITEFKPLNDKMSGLKEENRTLTELVAKLKEKVEERKDMETGSNYKKNIIGELSEISTRENFEIRKAKKGVEINLPGLRLFNPGEEKLSSEGLLLLSKLGKILKNASNGEIKIEGHTDDTKIGGTLAQKFPSNWELSAARAVNVVRYLQEKVKIPPKRLSVVAYGQYRPLFPNDSEEHKQKNRRIVIILEPPKEKGISKVKTETKQVEKKETKETTKGIKGNEKGKGKDSK